MSVIIGGRFRSAPQLLIHEGTSAREEDLTAEAVQLVNAGLPERYDVRFDGRHRDDPSRLRQVPGQIRVAYTDGPLGSTTNPDAVARAQWPGGRPGASGTVYVRRSFAETNRGSGARHRGRRPRAAARPGSDAALDRRGP